MNKEYSYAYIPQKKSLVGIGLAGVLSLGIVWGDRAPAMQAGRARGHRGYSEAGTRDAIAEGVMIQKPGH